MLNEILGLLNRAQVFELLGIVKSQQLVIDIVNLACGKYDCNPGEILGKHGVLLGICYSCLSITENLEEGLCPKCRD